jgi:hypothetical protein
VPLGDPFNRRLLIVRRVRHCVSALVAVFVSPSPQIFVVAGGRCRVASVVQQVINPYAAALSRPGMRGRVIGIVTS